jgi:hypothetical protein
MLTEPVENSTILPRHMAVYPRVPRRDWIQTAMCHPKQ